jgi:hypothetical protein
MKSKTINENVNNTEEQIVLSDAVISDDSS